MDVLASNEGISLSELFAGMHALPWARRFGDTANNEGEPDTVVGRGTCRPDTVVGGYDDGCRPDPVVCGGDGCRPDPVVCGGDGCRPDPVVCGGDGCRPDTVVGGGNSCRPTR